jgi:cyclin B
VNDFVTISDKAYTREQIIQMEAIMLSTLEFNFTVPSTLRFIERFNKIANFTDIQKYCTYYLLQMILQNYKFLGYVPSIVAASAVWIVMNHENMQWVKKIINIFIHLYLNIQFFIFLFQ